MTKVTIEKRNGSIVKVTCDGHTNYGVSGEDIVCAALSSIVQTAVLGLFRVAEVNINMERDDERGYLMFALPETISEDEQKKADVITETMLLGISDLNEGFSDFIELEVTKK